MRAKVWPPHWPAPWPSYAIRPFAIAVDENGLVKAKRMLNTITQLAELTTSVARPPVSANGSASRPA
ncbi:MAG TPA: hypothetical protein VGH27_24455 [Streptosporangiaceae bacterium]